MRFSERLKDSFKGGFFRSVDVAVEGIIHTLRTERNMRFHFIVAFVVLIAGIYLDLSRLEFMFLCFAVTFVLFAEMINTAVEYSIDLINDEYHPLAKIIKDISAGAVFVSAVNAIVTGYILFVTKVQRIITKEAFIRIKQSPWHLTMIALLTIVALVIIIKVLQRRERSFLRGGMPSGHSALAFSVWTIVTLVTENPLASVLVLFLALFVARARVTSGVHTFWETVVGGVLGILITLLIFQVLS